MTTLNDNELNLVTSKQILELLKKAEIDVLNLLEEQDPEYNKFYKSCVIYSGEKYLIKEKNFKKYKEDYMKTFSLIVAHGINTGKIILNSDWTFLLKQIKQK